MEAIDIVEKVARWANLTREQESALMKIEETLTSFPFDSRFLILIAAKEVVARQQYQKHPKEREEISEKLNLG